MTFLSIYAFIFLISEIVNACKFVADCLWLHTLSEGEVSDRRRTAVAIRDDIFRIALLTVWPVLLFVTLRRILRQVANLLKEKP